MIPGALLRSGILPVIGGVFSWFVFYGVLRLVPGRRTAIGYLCIALIGAVLAFGAPDAIDHTFCRDVSQ